MTPSTRFHQNLSLFIKMMRLRTLTNQVPAELLMLIGFRSLSNLSEILAFKPRAQSCDPRVAKCDQMYHLEKCGHHLEINHFGWLQSAPSQGSIMLCQQCKLLTDRQIEGRTTRHHIRKLSGLQPVSRAKHYMNGDALFTVEIWNKLFANISIMK